MFFIVIVIDSWNIKSSNNKYCIIYEVFLYLFNYYINLMGRIESKYEYFCFIGKKIVFLKG